MSRGPLTFQKGEVKRLTEAVLAAGLLLRAVNVEIGRDGSRKLSAVIRGEGDTEPVAGSNEWDGAT